jgi:hypothetical protein
VKPNTAAPVRVNLESSFQKRVLQNPASAVRLSAVLLNNNKVEVSRQVSGLCLYVITNAEEKESADRNMS